VKSVEKKVLLFVGLVELAVKSGGKIFLSRDTNTPVVSNAAHVNNAEKYLLLVECRLRRSVSTHTYVAYIDGGPKN